MTEDLWGDIDFEDQEENLSIDILRQQAGLIGKKTNGVVKGTLYKTGYKLNAITIGVEAIGAAMKNLAPTELYEQKEAELDEKIDYNTNYYRERYCFEIYNEEYRFRVLNLNYSQEYPNELQPDEGICQEIKSEKIIIIKNNSQLENVIKNILSTKKIRLIISRMINRTQEKVEEKIMKYAKDHPVFTTKELASEMGWSQANTNKRLEKMVNNQLIVFESSKAGKKWKVVGTI